MNTHNYKCHVFVLYMQRSYFCHFLTKNGLHAYCKIVSNAKMERLKMPWRTVDNVEDCGVFLMRHMETYKGEREGCWNCGLKKSSSGVLQSLRAKYCSTKASTTKLLHQRIMKRKANTLKLMLRK